jgi:ParB-like chromosome segregation protein Spo0J
MEDQTFSDNNGTYSVPQIVNYATENKTIKEMPLEPLLHNLEPSPHEEGDELPDLKYPIIIVKYPDGLFIADGVHRLAKAHSLNQQTIKAYVLDQNELEQFKM